MRKRRPARPGEDRRRDDRHDEADDGDGFEMGRRAAPEEVRRQSCEREGARRQAGRDEALMPGPFGRIAMRGFVNEPGEPEFNR